MQVPTLPSCTELAGGDKITQPAPSAGLLSWLWPTSAPKAIETPIPQIQVAEVNPLAHKVKSCWQNRTLGDAPRCWEQIKVINDINLAVGNKSYVQAFYTAFSKQIHPSTSLTLVELDTDILMASVYGARPWNDLLWFSAGGNSGIGLVSAENRATGQTHFFPFQGMSDSIVPMLVASHSKSGPAGYLCVFESNIGEVGVSLWNINAESPEKIFHQTGFEDLFFWGEKHVIGFRHDNRHMECWNLESHALEYNLEGWCRQNHTYIAFSGFNAKKHILLAGDGQYVYAFDLAEKKFAYMLDLTGLDGNGFYHTRLVGDNLLYCRGDSGSKVTVFEIASGKARYSFDVGGAFDYKATDDFPMRVLGDVIAALKVHDRKTIYLRQADSGEITQTFGPTSQDVTGIYFAEGRLIAACQWHTDKRVQGFHDQIFIWDLESGQQLHMITAPCGYDMSVQDITEGKLTLYLQKFGDEAMPAPMPRTKHKNADFEKFKKPLSTPLTDGFHWTNPYPLQLLESSIRLEVWNTQSCTHLGSIQEEFTCTEGLPLFATYASGKFVLDSDQSVLVQHFQ